MKPAFMLLPLLVFMYLAPPPAQAQSKAFRDAVETAKRNLVILFPVSSAAGTPDPEARSIGCGFFLSLPCSKAGQPKNLYVLITCRHALEKQAKVHLRFNTKKPNVLGSLILDLRSSGQMRNLFFSSDKRMDLAAVCMENLPANVDSGSFSLSQLLDETKWGAKQVGEGSMAASIAPVYGYPGISRNRFAVRYGRIALVSPEFWFNERDENIFEKAFLVDIALNHGSSGTPLFLCNESAADNSLSILGVVKGATDVPSGRDLSTDARVEVPLSVTAFEPAASLQMLIKELIQELETRGYKVAR